MEWLDPMSVARRRAQTRSAAAAAEGRGKRSQTTFGFGAPDHLPRTTGFRRGFGGRFGGGRIPVGPVALAVLLGISK